MGGVEVWFGERSVLAVYEFTCLFVLIEIVSDFNG